LGSTELCGGSHVSQTGRIGLLKLTAEAGVSAGVRRIEAVTGEAAIAELQDNAAMLARLAERLRAQPETLLERVDQELARNRELEREVERLQQRLASQAGNELADQAQTINGVSVLAATIEGAGESLRETVDQLKNKLGSAVVVLASVNDGQVRLVAGVTADLTGRGGGRADFAQAGGHDAAALPAALASVSAWVEERRGS
jgi:alanyl-tRNA synthetase